MTTATGTPHTGTPPTGTSTSTAPVMRNVYFARFGFAIVLAVTASSLDSISDISALTVVLLVLYPLVDLGAAFIDRRSSAASRSRTALNVSMALSLLAAVGLAIAVEGSPMTGSRKPAVAA